MDYNAQLITLIAELQADRNSLRTENEALKKALGEATAEEPDE